MTMVNPMGFWDFCLFTFAYFAIIYVVMGINFSIVDFVIKKREEKGQGK